MLEVRLLGPIVVARDGEEIRLASQLQRNLIARLALDLGRPLTADQLIGDLWPEEDAAPSTNALQVLVFRVRKLLGPRSVVTVGRTYVLLESEVTTDLSEFENEIRRGRTAVEEHDDVTAIVFLSQAISRWRGVPLQDAGDAAFAVSARARLEEQHLSAAELSASARLRLGQPASVVSELGPLSREHPFRESLVAIVVLALAASGRQADALSLYARTKSILSEEFGVDPSRQLQAAFERVLRDEATAPESPARTIRLGLPEAPPGLIGRGTELKSLLRLVDDPEVRLVSIVGVGGVGKTRMGQAIVEAAADRAAWVSLLAAERPDDVISVIAQQLRITNSSGGNVGSIATALSRSGSKVVLVLDNFEHVLDAAPILNELLANVPGLTIVVTTRLALGVPAEHRFQLEPLQVDAPLGTASAAVLLLFETARRIDSGFSPTAADRLEADSIVRLCEGLPLAIQLAGNRTNVLDLGEIRERLKNPLSLLVNQRSTAGRNSSMRASVEWSIDLLPPSVRSMLASITVFVDGFGIEAAAAVAGCSQEEAVASFDVLLDHSLLIRKTRHGRRRFDLLQVVRDTARERLAPGEMSDLADRHAHHFRDWFGRRPIWALFPTSREQYYDLDAERSNLRAAIRHALGSDPDTALVLLRHTAGPWRRWGDAEEWGSWLRVLLRTADLSPGTRFDARLQEQHSRFATTEDEFDRAVAEAVRLDPAILTVDRRIAIALLSANAAAANYRPEETLQHCTEIEELSPTDHESFLVRQLAQLRSFAEFDLGDAETAVSRMRAVLESDLQLGEDLTAVIRAINLSEMLLDLDRHQEAAEALMRVIHLPLDGDLMTRAQLLVTRGTSLLFAGDFRTASVTMETALSLLADAGSTGDEAEILFRYAAAIAFERPMDAAYVLGVSRAVTPEPDWEAGPLNTRLRTEFLSGIESARVGSDVHASFRAGEELVRILGATAAVPSAIRTVLTVNRSINAA